MSALTKVNGHSFSHESVDASDFEEEDGDTVVTSGPHHQLERIQAELASRASVHHFAHAAVSLLAAIIAGGSAARMASEGQNVPAGWAIGVACAAVVLLGYSFVRGLLGAFRLQEERKQFQALKALRRALRLDDPSALLPQ